MPRWCSGGYAQEECSLSINQLAAICLCTFSQFAFEGGPQNSRQLKQTVQRVELTKMEVLFRTISAVDM